MVDTKEISKELLIGRRKYEQLKSLKTRTKEEDGLIEMYEDARKPVIHNPEKLKEYYRKVFNPEPKDEFKMCARKLANAFLFNYKKYYDKDFIIDDNTDVNLKTIAYYFANDDRFFKSPILVNHIYFDGFDKFSKPSLKKGLLIIGNFGNGKTSMLKTFQKTLASVRDHNFSLFAANDLVKDYNCLNSPQERKRFWQKVDKRKILIDDAKTEEEASNYGKINLIKHLIETRSDHNKKTHIICNFKKGSPNSIEDAILEIGEKYGDRVFDRLFENYNIINFKGKSFRC